MPPLSLVLGGSRALQTVEQTEALVSPKPAQPYSRPLPVLSQHTRVEPQTAFEPVPFPFPSQSSRHLTLRALQIEMGASVTPAAPPSRFSRPLPVLSAGEQGEPLQALVHEPRLPQKGAAHFVPAKGSPSSPGLHETRQRTLLLRWRYEAGHSALSVPQRSTGLGRIASRSLSYSPSLDLCRQ